MPKSADAFRTISEVAEWLETPAHVLRFWESKFSQVKPVKRAGGRRYYRPTDMKLLGGIKKLLHEDGMTIKGVQKMLREQGIKEVAALSQPLDEVTNIFASEMAEDVTPDEMSATVLSFNRGDAAPDETAEPEIAAQTEPTKDMPPAPQDNAEPEPVFFRRAPEADTPAEPEPETGTEDTTHPAPEDTVNPAMADDPDEMIRPDDPTLPSFLNEPEPETAEESTHVPDATAEKAVPKPARVTVPDDPLDDIPAEPGVLAALAAQQRVPTAVARQLEDLAARLKALHG